MFDNVINTYQNKYNEVKERLFPNNRIVLVGGCLRDTFYGVEVKDLDFVIEVPVQDVMPFSPWNRQHQIVFGEVFNGQQAHYILAELLPEYDIDNNGVVDIVESDNKDVNFIFVRDIPTYTKQFPDSISKMVFDGETIHVSRDWVQGHENNSVYYRADIKEDRLDKLQRKYPNKEFIIDGPGNFNRQAVLDLPELAEVQRPA